MKSSNLIKGVSLIFLILLTNISFAQSKSILEYAIELRNYIETSPGRAGKFSRDTNQAKQYIPVLMEIFDIQEADAENFYAELTDVLDGNPFIGDGRNTKIFINETQASIGVNLTNLGLQARSKSLLEAGMGTAEAVTTGSSFITNAVDGFSTWLVKRTKQEMALTFFNRFKKALDEKDDLKMLFGETVGVLDVIDNEIYQYDAYLKSMRQAFIYDFKLLPYSMPGWAEKTSIIKDPTQRFLISESLRVPPMILDGKNPNEIISHFAKIENTTQNENIETVLAGFRGINLISNSILNPSGDYDRSLYIDPDKWESEIDNITMYLYLGILWQKAEGITISGNSFNDNLLKPIATDDSNTRLSDFSDFVYGFLRKGKDSYDFLKQLKKDNSDDDENSVDFATFHQYSKTMLEFIELADDFRIKYFNGQTSSEFQQIMQLLDYSNNLVFHVRQQNYLQGASELSLVVEEFFSDQGDFENFKTDYFKYITFMATMADAETPTEIELAFDAFALPAGSSKMKKYSPRSVAINAYVGFAYGIEDLEKTGEGEIFALSAPVGINLNWGFNEYGSFSLFAPLLDVGAVTAFRFNDATSTLPELTLQNLFAPGLYAVYGFGNDLPFALSLGFQMGPNTRKIEFDNLGNPVSNEVDSGIRFGGSLSVDIPVFHLYAKGKGKKKKRKNKKK